MTDQEDMTPEEFEELGRAIGRVVPAAMETITDAVRSLARIQQRALQQLAQLYNAHGDRYRAAGCPLGTSHAGFMRWLVEAGDLEDTDAKKLREFASTVKKLLEPGAAS